MSCKLVNLSELTIGIGVTVSVETLGKVVVLSGRTLTTHSNNNKKRREKERKRKNEN